MPGLPSVEVARRARCSAFLDRQPQLVLLQPADLVAQPAGFLELEVGGGFAHALLEVADVGAEVVADEVRPLLVAGVDQHAVAQA